MNPESARIGPCRYLAAAKPRLERELVSFLRCGVCGTVLTGLPSPAMNGLPVCCGSSMEKLTPRQAEELPGGTLDYDIVGGLNENCVRAYWTGQKPAWLYLETFTGGQLFYLDEKSRSPAVFALGGKDAYAYCDKDPCEMCKFRCKSGFSLYAYYEGEGLFVLPLNRIGSSHG